MTGDIKKYFLLRSFIKEHLNLVTPWLLMILTIALWIYLLKARKPSTERNLRISVKEYESYCGNVTAEHTLTIKV